MDTLLFTQRTLKDRLSKYGLLSVAIAAMILLLLYNRALTTIFFDDTLAARLSVFTITELLCLFFVLLVISNLGGKAEYLECKFLNETFRKIRFLGKRSNDRLWNIIDSSDDVIWSFDLAGRTDHYLSRSAEKIYGEPHYILLKNPWFWSFRIHPDDIDVRRVCTERLFETGYADSTFRIVTPEKRTRWMYNRVRMVKDRNGNALRLEGISTDVTYLKQAEQIIERQELQINAVVENLDMAIVLLDVDGAVLLVNKQAKELNRKNGRVVTAGMNFFDFFDADAKAKRRKIFSNVIQSRLTANIVVEHPNVNGEVHYYSVDYIPVLDTMGDVTQVCIMTKDITQQRLAEEELRERKKLLRAVIDNLPDYIYVKDSNLKHIINNKANLRLIGAPSDQDTLGRPTLSYFPEDAHSFLEDDQQILSTGIQIINKEEKLIGSNGRTHWLLTTKVPLKRDDGTVSAIVGISRDITEQKEMELSIRLSNERFKMACQVTDDAIWDWDVATNEVYFGENFKNLFGHDWDLERVDLSEWSRYLHPNDKERIFESIEKFLKSANNSRWEEEYRYICADGQTAYVRDRGLLICDDDGKPVRIIGAMQNVTEIVGCRKSLEARVAERTKELNKALQKEKEMVAVKNRFVSIASHEFRTPLSTIQFASGFLRKFHHKIKPEEINKKLEGIEKQVQLMTVLLDDVLTLGKTEAGKLKVTLTTLDVVELLGKICDEIETATRERCRVERTFASPTLIVSSDEKFLRNIFVNLIGNAVKFSPERDRVYLVVEPGENEVTVRVRDQGVGIPSADLEAIFEPFQRGNNVNGIEGTGLGLSIVKKAVDALGGQVFVKSKEGEGTEFTVKLPTQ